MVFWIGILTGAILAGFAVKKGFYETWAMSFNLVISIYLAVFLTPVITDIVPAAGNTPYGNTLTMLATAIAAFLILYGISYTFLTGQFSVSFPKILDTVGAGFLGFWAGFLIWSFVSLLICASPLSQNAFAERIGFDNPQTSISYISWWGSMVNTIVSSQDSDVTSEQVIAELLKSVERKKPGRPKPAEPPVAVEPDEVETGIPEEELLGQPPEADVEGF